jgi:formate hydrogenlyase subunit 3/multisubunit Na+/H+ antiporter MnhD subunit
MIFVGLSLALFALGAVFSRRAFSGYAFAALGAACALAAGVLGLLGLIDGNATIMLGQQPLGLGIDHLSAIFLTISSVVWLLVALFGLRYGDQFRRSATVGFNLALMGITIVVTAIDAVSFLVGWELMTMFVFLMLLERSSDLLPGLRRAFDGGSRHRLRGAVRAAS